MSGRAPNGNRDPRVVPAKRRFYPASMSPKEAFDERRAWRAAMLTQAHHLASCDPSYNAAVVDVLRRFIVDGGSEIDRIWALAYNLVSEDAPGIVLRAALLRELLDGVLSLVQCVDAWPEPSGPDLGQVLASHPHAGYRAWASQAEPPQGGPPPTPEDGP